MRTRFSLGFAALAAVCIAGSGCGDDGTTGGTGTGSGGGSGKACGGADVDVTGCTTTLSPSSDDTTGVQTALINAKSGNTVCMCPGTFKFTKQLSLTVPSVTVKGVAKTPDETILDFAGVTGGANDTMLITADGFTIENLSVQNTPGNGVVVRQADKPTFRKLKVSWAGGISKPSNGAYSIYPAECTNVLVEDCEVVGAADAAIYVGQGTGAIIRNNKAHGSVLGIELENTTNGEVYGNEIYENAGGMAVFLLGNLDKKTAGKNLVHDNKIHDNNHANFGDPKTFVASVPPGTGVIVVGVDDTEIRNNEIKNNESAAVLVVSYLLMQQLVPGAKADPMTDPFPERTFIHDNTYDSNGAKPHTPLDLIPVTPLENVLWDGIVRDPTDATKVADPTMSNDAKFCLGAKAPYPSFRMFAGAHLTDPDMGKAKESTDTTWYQCDLPALPSSM